MKVHLLNNCKTTYVLLMISDPAGRTLPNTPAVGPHAAIGRICPLEPSRAADWGGRRPVMVVCFVRVFCATRAWRDLIYVGINI